MTVILGTRNFMAADRRVTDGDTISHMVKIAKNPWLIAAASGDAASTLAVRHAVRRGARSIDDLVQHINKDSYALVLTENGALARIQAGTVWPHNGLDAIGSGADMALGYIGGSGETQITPDLVRRAFKFISKHRADCSGFDVRSFL